MNYPYSERLHQSLKNLGIEPSHMGLSTGKKWHTTAGKKVEMISPADGSLITTITQATKEDYNLMMETAQQAFLQWRMVPAPKRGEIVRQIGEELRLHKEDLGYLVSWEMGKILQEGMGEVQEMIDIADFAVGQSRQLYGLTMHSERLLGGISI